jgi:ADP-ribose pyrophosphatase
LAENWEHLGSEKLFETPYFVLRSDRLRLPSGATKDPYYVIERPDATIIFPLTKDGEVILVRQYRPPLKRMELGLPAGLVEEGEKPETAARRELLEESGYSEGEWEILGSLASSPSLKDNWATFSSPAASRRRPRRTPTSMSWSRRSRYPSRIFLA